MQEGFRLTDPGENQVILAANIRLRAEMLSHFTQYQSAVIHYLLLDQGERLMVCFHGYNETAAAFEMIGDFLPAEYSLLSIDLPYHGKTGWKKGLNFDAEALWNIVSDICKRHGKKTDQLIVSGFSLGGRVALGFFQYKPENVERLFLLAPDGLKYNLGYRLITKTLLGRSLFRFTVNNPGWLLFGMKIGRRLRLINQSVFKFSLHYLQNKDGRKLLYDRWVVTRQLSPTPAVLKSTIRKHKIPVLLVYGSFDRIVPPVVGHQFCRDTGNLCAVEEIPCGHLILQAKNRKHLMDIIKKQQTVTAQL